MPEVAAESASGFTSSIGVCVHLEMTETPYANASLVEQEMLYIGAQNARVLAPGSNLAIYQGLAEIGVKFDIVAESIDLAPELAAMNQIAPYIESVEGPDEIDGNGIAYDGMTGAAAADAFQQALYAAVKGDPLLAGAAVLPFSLANNFPSGGSNLSTYGNLSAYADEGNIHAYASFGVPPSWWMAGVLQTTDTPGLRTVITETGNYTLPDGGSGVDQYMQATWMVDTLLDAYRAGVAQTYLYQLMDPAADAAGNNPELHFGLFNPDGSPKLAATALHDLTTILADTGAGAASFTPGSLGYSVAGLGYDGFSSLLEKSDGRFDIQLWQEPMLWNVAARTEYAIPPSSVTLTFAGTMYQVQVFDPLLGAAAVATYSDVDSITLSLGADALIVEVTPTGAATATAPATPPTISGLTTGTDTGASSSDGVTANACPTLYGSALAGSLVTLFDGASVLGSVVAGSNGLWAFAVTTPLAEGPQSITATATTASGQSAASAAYAVTIDDLAPTVASIVTDTASGSTIHPGQTVTFTLTLSAAVALDTQAGTPTLTLSDGGAATYDAADSTATSWVFATTVGGGATAGDLQATALSLNGATAIDLAGNVFADGSLGGVAGSDTGIVVDPTALPVTLGSGPDSIVVNLSEFAWQGDAQATFSVDGAQVGGAETVTAINGAATQAFTLEGNFGRGSHSVGVSFVNNLWSGTLEDDRKLYVDSIAAGGVTQTEEQALLFNGTLTFDSPALSTAAPAPVTLGSGPDSIVVDVSENAWQGDAQFTLSVDGTQVGGIQTATAEQAAGQSQAFTLDGNFGPGTHVVSVGLLNPAYGGSSLLQRTLTVDSVSAGGAATTPGATLTNGVPASFYATLAAGTVLPVTLGSGPDSIRVGISEDAYRGNAQFTLSVDGVQIGGVQTATALHGAGQSQIYTLNGSFGPGVHAVTVDYLNYANDGASPAVRNLYVDSVSANGGASTPASMLNGDGNQSYDATLVGTGFSGVTLGAGSGSITVNLSEDAAMGNARFTLSVDGTQIGGLQTASAAHALGQSQAFTLNGNFGNGLHFVTVAFQNQTDARNLYIDSVTAGGVTTAVGAEMNACFATVTATVAPITPHTVATGTWATAAFISASGAKPLDAGIGKQPLALAGGGSTTEFILHAGAANGDTIYHFKAPTAVTPGDFLELNGYGAGATLTQVNATTWKAASASGSIHDLFHIANGAMLVPANLLFVN
jgi:hypothetical protein